MHQQTNRTFQKSLIKFFTAVFGLLSLGILVAQTGLINSSESVFRFINTVPEIFGLPLIIVMQLGSFWVIIMVVLLLFILKKNYFGLLFSVAGLLSFSLSNLLKSIFEHERPYLVLQDVFTRTEIRDLIFAMPLEMHGYPSGHTTTIAALVSSVTPYLTRKQIILCWVLVALVGLGRLYAGVHFPLDIVGGVLLGYAIGILIRKGGVIDGLYNKFQKRSGE